MVAPGSCPGELRCPNLVHSGSPHPNEMIGYAYPQASPLASFGEQTADQRQQQRQHQHQHQSSLVSAIVPELEQYVGSKHLPQPLSAIVPELEQ